MPRFSRYTEAPYQGVSQAPAQVRLETQAEQADDVSVSIPSGATSRPPFDFLGQCSGLATSNMAFEYIPRGDIGDHFLTLSSEGGSIVPRLYKLADFDGATAPVSPIPVTISTEAQAYLDAGSPVPDTEMEALTVEDFTFILNRKVEVAVSPDSAPARAFEAMIWVRQAAFARKYEITVRHGVGLASTLTVTLETPNGKDAEDAEDVDTDVIAAALLGGTYPVSTTGTANGATLTGSLSSLTGSGFTVSRTGGVIYLSHPTLDFTIEASDGQGGDALVVVKERVQAFSDLPKKAPVEGFTVRLTQQTGTDQDDFFVRWEETAGAGTGIWAETIAPGSNLGLDPETLPVGLVYDQIAETWSIDVLGWADREAGDEDLNPDPGFVGEPIQDITFWQGRLILLHREGARLSSATNPLGLYPTTLSQVLDDDAFEIINPLTRQAGFRYAVAFRTRLILWGNEAQAQVRAPDGPLTTETVSVDPYAYYSFADTVRPQGANDRIYFAARRGLSASAVYELEVARASAEGNAEGDDMSVHVPRYLPPSLNRAATCPVNYLTLWGRSGDGEVTAHYYRYADRQRVQNAWMRWKLPSGCAYSGGFFINTRFLCFVLRGGVVHLLSADTADGLLDAGSVYQARLNYKVGEDRIVSKTYDAPSDTTEVVVPYSFGAVTPVAVVAAPGGEGGPTIGGSLLDAPEGTVPQVVSFAGSTLTLAGDWTSAPLIIGEPYTSTIRLSRIYYRDQAGRPQRAGRLILKKLTLDLDRTVCLKVRVQVGRREAREYVFESSLFDSPSADYDQINLYSGPWSVPLGGTSEDTEIDIIMDSHLPAYVLGYTWEGEVNLKAGTIQG